MAGTHGDALSRAALGSALFSRRFERHVHEVSGHEPDLELIAAQNVAHEQVVRAPILGRLRAADGVADSCDDGFVRVVQPVDHGGNVFGAIRRPLDRRQLGRVARVADGHAAQRLNPLRQQVD